MMSCINYKRKLYYYIYYFTVVVTPNKEVFFIRLKKSKLPNKGLKFIVTKLFKAKFHGNRY